MNCDPTNRQSNAMQRVFDALTLHPHSSTPELCRYTDLPDLVVWYAIRRLRSTRSITSEPSGKGLWLYSVRPEARRPTDTRGRPVKAIA